jgi:hypothetical protein
MARMTISLPDDLYRDVLARRGTRHEVNVSRLATQAVREYLRYGPEADEEMRELAREMETDPEYQEILAETDAVAGDGLAETDADPDDAAWLEALQRRFPLPLPDAPTEALPTQRGARRGRQTQTPTTEAAREESA